MRTWITARFTLDGFHSWPDAPEHREELRDRHFHLFQVSASLTVTGMGREVEIFDLRDALRHEMANKLGFFHQLDGVGSCDYICHLIIAWLREQYPQREYKASVFEGDWGGAEMEAQE